MSAAAAHAALHDAAESTPLASLDMSHPSRFVDDSIHPYFARLRREAPAHYCASGLYGPYWSITRYKDILAVDSNHKVFSSEGGITLLDPRDEESRMPMFIAMDPPKHDAQRKAVSPIVAPANLANFEALIRSRSIEIIEGLPVGETFDWVERVSIELTTRMLATLFDFPFADRRLLTHWSDVATKLPLTDADWNTRETELMQCLAYFTRLWNERVNAREPGNDLVSMLAHNPATRNMSPREYLGNLILLIVGGNDTTRNSMTGGVYFLNKFPWEYDKLRANPALIPNMVSEIIRYQTPLAYMRRRALVDFEIAGKTIKAGDKVAMWYVSGNRDADSIEAPDQFVIDRDRARQHISFGFGIHRCVGNRLAELQLRILWEELLKRHPRIEVVGEPTRVPSSFVRGYLSLPVRIPA
jgi:cytochrome P450